jgi:hypothetical protein
VTALTRVTLASRLRAGWGKEGVDGSSPSEDLQRALSDRTIRTSASRGWSGPPTDPFEGLAADGEPLPEASGPGVYVERKHAAA